LIFVQQPTTGDAGGVISPPVTVDLLDQFGNPLNAPFTVTVAIGNNPGNASLGGTLTQTSDGSPQVTFDDLTLDQPGTGYTLVASSTGGLSVNSTSFDELAAPANIITVVFGSGQSALVNKAFAAPLQALVTDGTGHPLAGITVTFTAPGSGASGTFANGSTTENDVTDSSGVATSSMFTANTTAGVYTVTATASSALATTANFVLTNLTADERFVNALYVDFLGRSGSQPELDGWAAALPSLGQAGVVNDIMRSTEALTRLVDTFYIRFLGRAAGGGEEMGWVGALSTGAFTEEQVISDILASPEFGTRAAAMFPGVPSDTAFVDALYSLLLNRSAEAGGVSGWLSALPALGRSGVANAFVGSTEYRGGAVRTFYGDPTLTPFPYQPFFVNLLHRSAPPSSGEVNGWVISGPDLLGIQGGIASSGEFYRNG
jgi:hypothetical protein